MHVHVVSAEGEAKFWLRPEIELARNYNYSTRQLREIESLIKSIHHELVDSWNRFFRS